MNGQPAPASTPTMQQSCIACKCSLKTHWADYHWIGCAGALAIEKLKVKQ